jgi:hypothetical protein
MGGLSGGSGGAILSVVQSLGVLIIPFLWKYSKNIFKIVLVIGGIIIFASVLVCGRSGLWAIVLGLPVSLLWLNGLFNYQTLITLPLVSVLSSFKLLWNNRQRYKYIPKSWQNPGCIFELYSSGRF